MPKLADINLLLVSKRIYMTNSAQQIITFGPVDYASEFMYVSEFTYVSELTYVSECTYVSEFTYVSVSKLFYLPSGWLP